MCKYVLYILQQYATGVVCRYVRINAHPCTEKSAKHIQLSIHSPK